jgi:AsmA-like C-terminal region
VYGWVFCAKNWQLLSDFTLADQVVTLRQLRAHGGGLGLTAAGSIDIPASRVDVQGTIIPLYGINTVLGKVPIVGDLVLGGKGQGLFAIRARVTGRLADPQVSVNPASAVTPGFVRGFFDLFTGSSGADSEPRPRQE